MKRRVWGLLLSAVMLVTSTGVGVSAAGEKEKHNDNFVEITTNHIVTEESAQDQQAVAIHAYNQGDQDAVVRTYLLEEDGETAEIQTEATNLIYKEDITDPGTQTAMEESLQESVTLKDGSKVDAVAEWKFETDKKDASRITARYLEVELPAGATLDYEMRLNYKTSEESYTKKVLVKTRAFIEEQEVTFAKDREDETKENEEHLIWSCVQEQTEAGAEAEQGGNCVKPDEDRLLSADNNGKKFIRTSANNGNVQLYFSVPADWSNNNYIIYANACVSKNENKWEKKQMTDTGKLSDTGQKIFVATMSDPIYGGYDTLQFQAYKAEQFITQTVVINSWTTKDTFNNKLWDGSKFVEFSGTDVPGEAAGETMYFVDLRNDTYTYSNVTALFYKKDESGDLRLVEEKTMQMPRQGIFSVTIPTDSSYVTFRADGYEIGTYYNFLGEEVAASNEKSFVFKPYYMDAFYYNYDSEDSYWNAYLSSTNRSLDDHVLYLDTRDMNGDGRRWNENNLTLTYKKKDGTVVTVQSGDGSGKLPKTRTEGIRYYHFPKESGASEYTKFTISDEKHTLRFLYVLQNETNMIRLEDAYWSVYSSTGDRHIFFDDTLSQYGTVYYKAWNSKNTNVIVEGKMVSISGQQGAEVVKNPEKVFVNSNNKISEQYDKIQFWKDDINSSITTGVLDIDDSYDYPCFKANPKNVAKSDKDYYQGGIWKSVLDVNDNGDHSLNVPYAEKTTVENAYYGITTFYDYYSDYELTGKNRNTLGSLGYTNERYQPSSVFNMALSDYYRENNSNPLYLGHFQWGAGDTFESMSSRVNLYGYEGTNSNFLYNNNSEYRKNGSKGQTDVAVQGLAGETLYNGNLRIGNQDAAFFDEEFLRGNNSKNTAIGYVYNNVQFPFVKNADGYWEFDSAKSDESLRLKRDADSGYFLDRTGEDIKGFTNNAETINPNFFPFNGKNESGNVDQLNYGFGARIDIKFRLTENGEILASDGKTSKPIVFNFSGDDDVWVYIDGKLALDIGGGHGAVAGQIDFSGKDATKKAAISKKKTDYEQEGVTVQEFIDQTKDGIPNDCSIIREFSIIGSNTDEHTLTMFYMERGLWESNMKITFNFPQENTLKVEKEIDTSNVNAIFSEAMQNMGTFEFDIQNYATHGAAKEVGKPDAPGKELIFNDYSQTKTVTGTGMNGSIVRQDEENKQFEWYYPGEKKATDSQAVTDRRLAKIWYAGNGPKDLTTEDGQLDYEYLEFQVFNDDTRLEGTSPFAALVDADGTRIGEWGSRLTYGGASNNIGKGRWKTIRIDLKEIQKHVLNPGSTAGFDFSKVQEIQFAYWDDVYLKVGPMVFEKPPKVSHTGFTTEQKDIPDYGSIKENKLMPAIGAWYEKSDGNTYIVDDGTFNLGNHESVVFGDQFRRGSYVYIEEKDVNPEVFDTRWTIYENDIPVQDGYLVPDHFTRNKITSVSVGNVTTVQNVSGTVLNDGRTELNPNANVTRPENAIVFRSYKNPDNEATVIDLKAKFTNKLKTGNLYLEKSLSQGETSLDENQEYTFLIEYRNIAGMSLESTLPDGDGGYRDFIVQEIKLKAGESMMITGIPAGTDYTISEVKGDNFNLESITIKQQGNDTFVKVENNVVTGVVVADEPDTGTATGFTFVNSLIPAIEIRGTKTWEGDLAEIPNDKSIVVQLQQKQKGQSETEWKQATDKNGDIVLNQIVNVSTNWEYFFANLLKYVNYKLESPVPYEYRVVELGILKERGELSGLEPDPQKPDHIKPLDGYYPEYSTDSEGNMNIRNKKSGNITINKKTENNAPLEGVEFTLYNENQTTIAKDLEGNEIRGATNSQGQIFFKNIPSGTAEAPITYYLKETKTVAGHVLLKDPIKVVLPFKYKKGDIVNGQTVDEDGVTWRLTYTIINDKAFDLPASGTGGITKYLMIGMALAVAAGTTLSLRQAQVRNNRRSRKKRFR